MTDVQTRNKGLIAQLRAAQYDFEADGVRAALAQVSAQDAVFRLSYPFGEVTGADAFYDTAYAPLLAAMPDLERRDWIVIAGPTDKGSEWVGCAGHYVGTFTKPFLDIPATGHIAHMRFHEFYRIEDGRVAEFQAIWDIPELMMQAGAWPMVPSLGRELMIPGPAGNDGLVPGPYDADASAASYAVVINMLEHLVRHPRDGGPEVMEMPRFWHPKMMWYGPAGIGSARGHRGFRAWHQIPFLNGMPDRGFDVDRIVYHFFADGPFVGVTGWPNMVQTLSHPGWLGIAPPGKVIRMKSLDFWRVEGGLIRENWVLVDLLDMYDQIGVSPLDRMREFNKARSGFDPDTGHWVG